jgi:nicotinate dehydrogenase subunit B
MPSRKKLCLTKAASLPAIGTYPVAKMTDVPEIKVVLIHNLQVGAYGGGSEAANALAAPAIAAALHDATGKVLRRLPLKRAYVQDLLKA